MSTYLVSDPAKIDLIKIWWDIWDLSKSDEFADKFIDQLERQFSKLPFFPKMGESRDYLVKGFRKWTFKKYIIYYTEHKDYIRIERVLWGKQDQKKYVRF